MQNRKLPPNWSWVKLGDVGDVVAGGTPSTTIPEYFDGKIAWVTPADLTAYSQKYISQGRRNITDIGLKNSSARIVPKGSILFSSRAPIGYVAIASNELCTNQGFKNLIPNNKIDSEFVYYYLKSAKQLAEENASGTTFKEISAKSFANLPIPLPPLPVQHKIVGKIEKLFSELDSGVANLRKAKEQIKTYRQSVLAYAFSGKLKGNGKRETEELNDPLLVRQMPKLAAEPLVEYKANDLPQGWKWVKLGDEFEVVTGTTPSKDENKYYGNGFPFYKPTDLNAGINVIEASDNLTELGIQKARLLPIGSVLITCIGATIGKTGLIKTAGASNQQINTLVCNDRNNPKYVYYFCVSEILQKQIRETASSTTLPILNKSKFNKLEYLKLPIDSQTRIVSEIERRFSVADKLEQTIDESLKKAELLKQSILKRAFEGKLV